MVIYHTNLVIYHTNLVHTRLKGMSSSQADQRVLKGIPGYDGSNFFRCTRCTSGVNCVLTRLSDPGYEGSPGYEDFRSGYEGMRSGARGYEIRGTRV